MSTTKSNSQRLGLVVPSSNTVMEVDFYTHLTNKEVTLHVSRMYITQAIKDEEECMVDDFSNALKTLATVEPDIAIFGCTSGGTIRGTSQQKELEKQIKQICSCKALTVTGSVSTLLHENNAKKIVLISPYIDYLNECVVVWLESEGFEVRLVKGMKIVSNLSIGRVKPSEIVEFTLEALNEKGLICGKNAGKFTLENVDAIFLSCTNMRGWETIDILKEKVDSMILSSNQATFICALRELQMMRC